LPACSIADFLVFAINRFPPAETPAHWSPKAQ
jgi:hypothetical protein